MTKDDRQHAGWKPKLVREVTEYLVNFVYLACFFGLFTWYRRLVLAEYGIAYINYGTSLIEALVLAKIIMLGDILRLGRRLDNKPLILPTIYRSAVFTVWTGLFDVAEHILIGVLRHKSVAQVLAGISGEGRDEIMARCLVIFFAFIPFFAFKGLGQIFGEGEVYELLIRKRPDTQAL